MYSTALVRQMVAHFADLAGYEGHVLVTFDKQRFDRACARYRLEPADDEDYGEAIVGVAIPMVWVNQPENRTFARLARTCAHEALHIAQPKLPHGPAFERGISRLLRSREP